MLDHAGLDRINDAKNRGIDRSARTAERGDSGTPLHDEEDCVADAGLGRVNRNDDGPERLVVRRHWLDE